MDVLYGPPGAGKSTRVRDARAAGLFALDLEDLWSKHKRLKADPVARTNAVMTDLLLISSIRKPDVLGAAGFGLGRLRQMFPDANHILLLPPIDVYRARRAQRDLELPYKAGQVDNWVSFAAKAAEYDQVIDT